MKRLYRRCYNRVLIALSYIGLSQRFVESHYYHEG